MAHQKYIPMSKPIYLILDGRVCDLPKQYINEYITEICEKMNLTHLNVDAVVDNVYPKLKEYNTFGGGSQVTYDVMGESWWKNLHAKRIAKKIPCRQVFDETIRKFGNELNKKPMTKIRFLPKEYAQLQETIIIEDYVGIAIFTDNPYGILIKDKVVAGGYRKQFEILWNKAEP